MRLRDALVLAAAGALITAPAAAAHVTVTPNEVPPDSFARFDVRVPNEEQDADTIEVSVQMPAGLDEVSYQPKPGWTRTVKESGGTTTVTWSGGKIGPGEFDEFGISVHVPNTAGAQLVFPSLQRYSNGDVVRWIGPPDAEEPAPRVTLAADSGGGGDNDGVALGLASGGLVAGLAALGLVLTRRPRRSM